MSLYEDTRQTLALRDTWFGKVAVGATDLEDRIMVTIPDLDPSLRIGPCRWQSRDGITLPGRGDDCLVIFDNNREPWVVAWWPFA